VSEHRLDVGSALHSMLLLRRWLGWVIGAMTALAIAMAAADEFGSGIRASAAAGAGGALLAAFFVARGRRRCRDAATGLMGEAIYASCRRALGRRARPHRPIAVVRISLEVPGGERALSDRQRRQAADALLRALDERDHAFATGRTGFAVMCLRVDRARVEVYGSRLRSAVHASLPPYLAIGAQVTTEISLLVGASVEEPMRREAAAPAGAEVYETTGRVSVVRWLAAVTRSRPSRLEA
jgi:hypothetical protein